MTPTPLFATSATLDITPHIKIPIGGYGHKDAYQDIESHLEINGVWLSQGDHQLALLSLDTLYTSDALINETLNRLPSEYKLDRSQIMWGSSHTHYAPMLDPSKPKLGPVHPDYFDQCISACVQLLIDLQTQPLEKVDVTYGKIKTDLSVCRRHSAWNIVKKIHLRKSMTIFPNPEKNIHESIHKLTLSKKSDNTPLATIWTYPSHPTNLPSSKVVSSHFPGAVRQTMREKEDSQYPILFFQGFSGDIKAHHTGQPTSWKQSLLYKLNKSANFQNFTHHTYRKWVAKLSKAVSTLSIKKQRGIHLKTTQISEPLSTFFSDRAPDQDIQMVAFQWTPSLVMIGLSAEVVSDYVPIIEACHPSATIIPIGCINHSYGYLPTDQMVEEGGYESDEFRKPFSIKAQFKKNLEATIQKMAQTICTPN